MERFLFLFLNHPAPGAQLWVLPHLCLWATHISLLPRLPWSTQVCPGKGRVWRWHNCLGRRCPGGDSCVRKPAATCARAPALVGAFPSAWQQVWRQAREGQPWWGLFLAPGWGRGRCVEREAAMVAPPPACHSTVEPCFYGSLGFLHKHSWLWTSPSHPIRLSPHSQQQSSPQFALQSPGSSSQPPCMVDTHPSLGHTGLWHGPSV